jgi:hypothetical protein
LAWLNFALKQPIYSTVGQQIAKVISFGDIALTIFGITLDNAPDFQNS